MRIVSQSDATRSKKALTSVVFMAPDGTVLGRVRKMVEPDAFMSVLRPATTKLSSLSAK